MAKLQGDDDDPGYTYVKNVNRMNTQLQAPVQDHPCQLTAGKLLGTVMACVHAPRPPLRSVRDGTDQPGDSSHSPEYIENVTPLGERIKSYVCELSLAAEPALAYFIY